jgi:hypothetical protein
MAPALAPQKTMTLKAMTLGEGGMALALPRSLC